MLAMGFAALLLWGAMMGTRSYVSYRLAREYGAQELGWREIAARRLRLKDDPGGEEFRARCVEYFAQLSAKYRRAMWHPWMPVAPDPHAPGYDLWVEQEKRAKEAASDPPAPGARPLPRP
jgi:hypothetical protein